MEKRVHTLTIQPIVQSYLQKYIKSVSNVTHITKIQNTLKNSTEFGAHGSLTFLNNNKMFKIACTYYIYGEEHTVSYDETVRVTCLS